MSSVSPYQLIKRGVQRDVLPSTLRFIKALTADAAVASITPSSLTTSENVCEMIDFSEIGMAVELGPGDGAITKGLLTNLPLCSKLYAVESNETFVELLENAVVDRRLTVFHQDARDFFKETLPRGVRPDLIVSGIPFSLFSDESARYLLSSIARNLSPGGQFISYQTWLPPFFTPKRLKTMLSKDFEIENIVNVYRNIPPLQVVLARRR